MQFSWHSKVVDRLAEHRANGQNFDMAWSLTMRELPPPSGEATPRLFDETGNVPETLVSFFRRACEAAWYDVRGTPGNGPAIRHFRVDMIRDVDDASPAPRARVGGRIRQAA